MGGSGRGGGVIVDRYRGVGAGGPEPGVDIGEDTVAKFDFGEARSLLGGEGAGAFEKFAHGLELLKLFVVGEETGFRVVAGSTGGDEELPVGGLKEKELAAELGENPGAEWGVSASGRG